MQTTMNANLSPRTRRSIIRYGVPACITALNMNDEGYGASSIAFEGPSIIRTTAAADAAIDAGRELVQFGSVHVVHVVVGCTRAWHWSLGVASRTNPGRIEVVESGTAATRAIALTFAAVAARMNGLMYWDNGTLMRNGAPVDAAGIADVWGSPVHVPAPARPSTAAAEKGGAR
jgi:hypothetical protein